jgi:hypothetical protein
MPPLPPKCSKPCKIKNNATSKGKFLNKNEAADEDGVREKYKKWTLLICQKKFVLDK